MSENYKRLDAVQQEIKDLIKKETKLRKKEQKGQLDDEDEIELEGIEKLLTELKEQQDRWFNLVEKENSPEETSKSFGEADAEWIASVTGINTKFRQWTSITHELDETVLPSPEFKVSFENISKAFHMRTEAGRRIFLNLFLSDIILLPEFKNTLRIFPEIEMSVETKGPKKRKLNGKTDYTIGFGKDFDIMDNSPPRELHMVALEAKTSFGNDDLWQCVAETATLYKSRKDAKKEKCSVWGVLSNATNWKFVYIDEDGNLWRSKEYLLEIRFYDEQQVLLLYRVLYFIMSCCFKAITPHSTPNTSTEELN
jgi:hypothetical protein